MTLIERLVFIANNTKTVNAEEIEEACDLAAAELERLGLNCSNETTGVPVELPHQTLMRFYGVTSIDELIDAQAKHIEKLQQKLPRPRDASPMKVREG